ncbi:MAG: transposase [Panacagrimonas sp.]
MARIPRIVVPGVPHHITQRGNRRQVIFHGDDDYALYGDLLAERCRYCKVEVWAYCLMPNHVHLILNPASPEGLSRAIGETHRRYTGYINARERVMGHLFQARFNSVAMDEAHTLAAIRYVAMNPVEAGLVKKASDWTWSSVRAHLAGRDDVLVRVAPVLERVPDFMDFLDLPPDTETTQSLLAGQSIGRPLMPEDRLKRLERRMGRRLRPLPRGRRPQKATATGQKDLAN